VLLHDVLGQIHYARREPEHAVACFRRALAVRADCAEVQYNLARVLQELRENEDAASAYHAAIAHKPDYAEAYNNLGALYLAMAKPREAIGHLQSAIKLKPDYADAYNNLGNAYRDVGNTHHPPSLIIHQVLTFQPGHAPRALQSRLDPPHAGQGGRGDHVLRTGDGSTPRNIATPHREMAALLLGLNLREEAIEAYQRGLKGNPHDDMTLALLLHQQGAHLRLGRHGAPISIVCPSWERARRRSPPGGMLALEDAPARPSDSLGAGALPRALAGRSGRPSRLPRLDRKRSKSAISRPTFITMRQCSLLGRMIALHDRDPLRSPMPTPMVRKTSSAYRSLFDRFYDVHRMDDQEVAALARKAGLDIAIDLKGAHPRMGAWGSFPTARRRCR
jgi:tetratricopeptide (TPR) repeat protein